MVGLIGLAYDPRDERLRLLPWFGQQLEGDHIQHLDGLIQGGIKDSQVVQPRQQEEEYTDDDEDV